VERPKQNVIGTKWVFCNKQDEHGVVTRNKARLVAQGFTQIEDLDFAEMYCWHFLTSSLGFVFLAMALGNAYVVCLNDYRINLQAHRYTIVAFHPESIQVSLFIFSRRMV
jgi:hypothetical protein